jgi:two-component system sensor histidine kinase HydH
LPEPDTFSTGRGNVTVATERKLQDLRELIGAYNDLAERLQGSHLALQREVARLREELAEKNRQLARKNRLEILGEMAAGLAHEVRNPLGSIELYAGLIARASEQDGKVLAWAYKIQRATKELSRTVGDILDFTRPLKPQAKSVLMDEVIDTALDLASSAIQASGTTVTHVRNGEAPAVTADYSLLQRAFLNVILNAIDAMPYGGRLAISTASGDCGGRAALAISFADTGPGIAPEDLPQIFDPFFTRKETGTGLGLAMTARIINAHGGKIGASNGARGGAIFTLTLPVEMSTREESSQCPL